VRFIRQWRACTVPFRLGGWVEGMLVVGVLCMAYARRWRACTVPFRLGGWVDKILVVGLLCMAASGAAVITQLGSTGVRALNIPADSLAQPYAGIAKFPQRPFEPQPAAASLATTPVAATPTPPPPCPPPSFQTKRGVPVNSPIIIVIKKLAIDAQIEQAALDRHGDMQVPANPCDVAWFKPGPSPGAPGDAVIDGHLDWTSGPSVFWNLHMLKRGDEIDIVQAGGKQLRFIVSRLRTIWHSTFQTGLFSRTGPPVLSLYTCAGTWQPWAQTYSQRLIVDAVLAR
jgi:hypothetical protein